VDAFSYLSVLLSIIIGLAVTQILQGFRARMLSHGRVQRYWPTQVWAAILLIVCTQTWWAMFDLRERTNWQFDDFTVLLAQTIVTYLLAGLVFPDFPDGKPVDLREHYFTQRPRFFALLLGTVVISIVRDLVLNHALPDRANLLFHLVYIALAIIGLSTAREWLHKVLALVTGAAIVLYVSLLFARLR
jgi:magnesium-transporting ATPase (P-type)